MSNPAFIIGNGQSRLHYDIRKLKQYGTVIGCNALYRDMKCDHYSAADVNMVSEMLEHPNKIADATIWTRESSYKKLWPANQKHKIKMYPPEPWPITHKLDFKKRWGSGVNAILLGHHLAHTDIFLLGFDLFAVGSKREENNVYKWTRNYSQHRKMKKYLKLEWQSQILHIFSMLYESNFYYVKLPGASEPDRFAPFKKTCLNYVNIYELDQFLKVNYS